LAAQDDVINKIASNQWLRKLEKRGEDNEPGAQNSFWPMADYKRIEVPQVGPDTRIAILPREAVMRRFIGKPCL
jgi:hypothetical protein